MSSKVSVILPVLNECELISSALSHLSSLGAGELIVVDGGSEDGTQQAVEAHAQAKLLVTPSGRARQMNAGAQAAQGEILLFAHVDIQFPFGALRLIREQMDRGCVGGGFFKRYVPANGLLRLCAWGLNHLLLRCFGRMVGTNGIFVRRDRFMALGGFPDLPILEDWRFAIALKSQGRLAAIQDPVEVSSRRYWKAGVFKQVITNGAVLFNEILGLKDPARLRQAYDGAAPSASSDDPANRSESSRPYKTQTMQGEPKQ